jgi:uncharacterized protein YndB with AHSA1/START domain
VPTYLLTNRVPADFTGSAAAFAAWTAWFDQLGDSLEDRGNPAFCSRALGDCGPGTVLGGYTLISADSLDDALALAQGHPLVGGGFGGGVEIGELTQLNKGRELITDPPAGPEDAEVPLEVSVRIAAPPQEVFGYLTDAAKYVQWMGTEAVLDPPDGPYRVKMSDGFAAAGTFTEVQAPRRVAFTWGWADDEAATHALHERPAEGSALPPGSTRVLITLKPDEDGTRLTLEHSGLPADLRDPHRVAWETYLPRLVKRAVGEDPGPDPHA